MGLPAEVLHAAPGLARRTGIDEEDALSLAAEVWWANGDRWDAFTYTIALRRCIDERRKVSGRNGPDRRPLAILDAPDLYQGDSGGRFGSSASGGRTIGDDIVGRRAEVDPAFGEAETRTDLAAAIGTLDDRDLATLARYYWLHLPGYAAGETDIMRAIRRARAAVRPTPSPPPPAPPRAAAPPPPRPQVTDCPLTPRQRQVVRMLADGLTYDQVAAELVVSRNTVKTTVRMMLAEIHADNAAHAVAIAMRGGWID